MVAPNIPSQSAPSNIADLDDWLIGDGSKVFVLKLEPTDLAGGTATLYLATSLYRGADAKPRLLMPASIDISVLNSQFGTGERPEDGRLDLEQFRAGQLSIGSFQAVNNDGELDSWPDSYGWAGADATLLFGDATDAIGSLVTFLAFKVRDEPTWSVDARGASLLTFSTKSAVLNPNGLVRGDVFAGTGGLEGDLAAEGKSKPILIGRVDNVDPFPLQDTNLGYMIDPDKVDSVDAVYEGGLSVGVAGTDWTNNGTTDGTFDLARIPIAEITVDAKGWTGAGRTGATSDYSLAANFVILAQDFGGSSAPSTAGLGEDGGLWIPAGADVRFSEALEKSIRPLGFYWPAQDGSKLYAGEIGNPADGTSARTYTSAHISRVDLLPTAPPAWQVRLGYRPLGRVITSPIYAVTEAEQARVTTPTRYIKAEDTSVQTDYPDAIALDTLSTLYAWADANTLATELLNIFKVKRNIYRVHLVRHPLAVWIGQVVTVDFPRYNLDGGKKVMVTGWSVRFGQSDPHGGSFVMECWG